ncbi:hypothetical protein [Salipiger sp.]|uniref:DUF4376 domain-containing protein n=1 Tax=Salipiger sp. TaxID=2078585 RepID=UPI003A972855
MPNIDFSQMVTAADKAARVQEERKVALHRHRERLIAEGTTVTVTGIGDVPLRGTPFDQTVLLSRRQKGADLIAAGDESASVLFRDAANIEHMLTGAQAVEMVDAGMAWFEDVMQASWAIKGAGPIPEDFKDPIYWPS